MTTQHHESEPALKDWYRRLSDCTAACSPERRQTFGSADYVDGFVVFDMGGNKYRVAAVINFDRQRAYVRDVMTLGSV
jgi:mRNA interferase HigB